ncbi:hypothetical protein FO519_001203 [Halicephalobus sp. NKZ332]|nr:hypothetical protein FO519_001203 [Halicephalobus sp. NKZ332]
MRFLLIFFFIQVQKIYFSEGKRFIWKPVSSVIDRDLWKDENPPCADSIISFEKDKLTIALIEKGLAAKEILLPDNGILYFDQYTLFGETPDWQCEFSREGQDVAFFEPPVTPNIFSSVYWRIEGEEADKRSRIHVEQIPSQVDEAVFPVETASRITINVPLIVGKLNYSNQKTIKFYPFYWFEKL